MRPLDLLADLPDPHDDEPPSLRADIADELADHLHCAHRREVLKDADDQAARQRVLDRFGDPIQLARRLWWQAMWSRVMKQRVLTGLQWIVSLSAVVLAAVVLWQQSQLIREMRTARDEQTMERQKLLYTLTLLQAQSATKVADPSEYTSSPDVPTYFPTEAPGRSIDSDLADDLTFGRPKYPSTEPSSNPEPADLPPPRLKLMFVADKADGPAVAPDDVDLYVRPGWKIPGIPSKIIGRVPVPIRSEDGKIDQAYAEHVSSAETQFPTLEPGRYELKVTVGGLSSTRQILIRDNQPQQMTIVCPSPRKKTPVTVTMPALPDDLQKAQAQLSCLIQEKPVTIDGIEWRTPVVMEHSIQFDAKTGKAVSLFETGGEGQGDSHFDLSKEDETGCLVFLPTGTVGLRYSLTGIGETNFLIFTTSGVVDYPPTKPDGTNDYVLRQVKSEGDRWDLEIPEQLLVDARVAMKKQTLEPAAAAPAATVPVANDSAAPVPGASPDKSVSDPFDAGPNGLGSPAAAVQRPALKLKFALEKDDGTAVKPTNLALNGNNEEFLNPNRLGATSEPGTYIVKDLQPNHYQLSVRLDDSQSCSRTFLLRDAKPREMTILCPSPRKKVAVLVTTKALPEALQKARFTVKASIWPGAIELGDSRWLYGNGKAQEVTFDPKTGYATTLANSEGPSGRHFTDFTRTPNEDRVVFLPTGPVRFKLRFSQTLDGPGSVPIYEWPDSPSHEAPANEGLSTHQIKADEDRWEIEPPQEFLDLLTKSLERGTLPTY